MIEQEIPKPEAESSTGESLPGAFDISGSPSRRSILPYVWATTGLAFGVVGTLLFVRVRPKSTNPRRVVLNAPAPSVVPPVGISAKPPTSPVGSAPQTLHPIPPDATHPTNPPANPHPAPMNPFGGSAFVLPKLPVPKGTPTAPLNGMILPRRIPSFESSTMAPTGKLSSREDYLNQLLAKGLPKAPPALKPPREAVTPLKAAQKTTLVRVTQVATDRQGAADDLIAYAKRVGGRVQVLTEQGDEGKPEINGLLATVPEAAVADLLKHIAAAGAVVERETWTGTSSDRRAKLAEDAEARIASLRKLRDALLVTYLEDAQPVKDVDEEIAKASKSLDQLQTDKAGDKMAFVRIGFVQK